MGRRYMVAMTNQAEMKRPRGRPPLADGAMLERVNIRVPTSIMSVIREIKAERKDGADLAQVIREVIVDGLHGRGKL